MEAYMKALSKSLFLIVLATVAVLVFSSVSFAEEQIGVKIENGVISFLGADVPSGNTKDLNFSFPPDSPKEILAIHGKIYRWKSSRTDQVAYLIPLEYNLGTKTITLLYVSNNKGTQYEPTKITVGGVYNGSEGSAVKPVNDKTDKPWARFYILPEQQNSKLRLAWQAGGDSDFSPVAEIFPRNKQVTQTVEGGGIHFLPLHRIHFYTQSSLF
jgi:hypothetical protein